MGDWEDVFGSAGMDPDFAPWDSPSWNDEWEYDLIDQGFKTVQEWNALNRIIKKGEKGKHLPSLQKMVFSEDIAKIDVGDSMLGQKAIQENQLQDHLMGRVLQKKRL